MGSRYHAKNAPGQSTWVFEEKSTSMNATSMILVRILVGKINDLDALVTRLRQVPIDNNDPEWNCVIWVQQGLSLDRTSIITHGHGKAGLANGEKHRAAIF